jgi:hypothetical protein
MPVTAKVARPAAAKVARPATTAVGRLAGPKRGMSLFMKNLPPYLEYQVSP